MEIECVDSNVDVLNRSNDKRYQCRQTITVSFLKRKERKKERGKGCFNIGIDVVDISYRIDKRDRFVERDVQALIRMPYLR
jgi:hypothetical protein